MATQTTNYGFTKDATTDYYSIATVNSNLDAIDTAIKGVATNLATHENTAFKHKQGTSCTQTGANANSFGLGAIANGAEQLVGGRYNIADTTSLLILGNGTADGSRSNAVKVDTSGNVNIAGHLKNTGILFTNVASYPSNTNYNIVSTKVWVKNGICFVSLDVKCNVSQVGSDYTPIMTGFPYAECEIPTSCASHDNASAVALLAYCGITGNLVIRLGTVNAYYRVFFSYPCIM